MTQDSSMTKTNESEAMEVLDRLLEALFPGGGKQDRPAATRVIATALGARDAELNDLRLWKLCAEEGLAERDARIAELEGALKAARPHIGDRYVSDAKLREQIDAILTKGNTHD